MSDTGDLFVKAGSAILGAAFALYPEIAKLVRDAKDAGALSESTLAAIARIDPLDVFADAERRIAAARAEAVPPTLPGA